jgi:poly-beta-1,6-N-acetyl-D-glucosamine synthase
MLTWIVWIVFFLTMYTYLVFPAFLYVLTKFRRGHAAPNTEKPGGTFRVAILCAMFNEEDVVRKKIDNFKRLKDGNLSLYIGSDGSTDRTNAILEEYAKDERIKIFLFPRRGKVHVLNDLMKEAKEEIFVFTDANSMFEPDAIQNLVAPFVDNGIGVVCGRLILLEENGLSGEGFYWRYETFIKKVESLFNCVIGANGGIYAIRRELVSPLPINTINDDFTISMKALARGYGIRYAENAVATEKTHPDDSLEFRRHVRDGAGHYRALVHLKSLMNPFHPKIFFFYVSHRVIRWFVPHMLVLMMVLPLLALENSMIRYIFALQVLFYALALIGYLSKTKMKCFYIPFYFLYINVALMIGFLKNLLGRQKVMWDRIRR